MKMLLPFIVFALLLQSPFVGAQQQEDTSNSRANSVSSFDLERVRNRPLTLATKGTATLIDVRSGKPIQRRTSELWARDSESRVFREVRSWVPLDSKETPKLEGFQILDPVTEKFTFCNLADKHCFVTWLNPPGQKSCSTLPNPEEGVAVSWVSLGEELVDGFAVKHTREVCNHIQHGLVSAVDFWISPDAGISFELSSMHPNKNFVTSAWRLMDRSFTEPSAELFTIPADFSVVPSR